MNGYRVPLAVILTVATLLLGIAGFGYSSLDGRTTTNATAIQTAREDLVGLKADLRGIASQLARLEAQQERLLTELSRLAVAQAAAEGRPR